MVGAPASATAGSAFNVTVTAKDPYGNIATSFGGTVAITSSDGNALLPASATLTNGTATFNLTLKIQKANALTSLAKVVTVIDESCTSKITLGTISTPRFFAGCKSTPISNCLKITSQLI